jgi:protocatechuate 3,4-dioxygenase, alpha subunit
MKLTATTWQTVGPFFRIGLERLYVSDLTVPGIAGERIEVRGRVLDGDEQPVPDAVIEIWQADAQGNYFSESDNGANDQTGGSVFRGSVFRGSVFRGSVFRGFGRTATSDDGAFHFKTIKPGQVAAPDGTLQAPHIAVSIFMRGLLRRLTTRMYFPDEPANDTDFALHKVKPARVPTLIAQRSEVQPHIYEWNILLQGADETVFFDC